MHDHKTVTLGQPPCANTKTLNGLHGGERATEEQTQEVVLADPTYDGMRAFIWPIAVGNHIREYLKCLFVGCLWYERSGLECQAAFARWNPGRIRPIVNCKL